MTKNSSQLKTISKNNLILKLGQSKHIILRLDAGATCEWGLYLNKQSGGFVALYQISANIIADLLGDGMVCRSGNSLALTKAGRKGIKRHISNNQKFTGQHQVRGAGHIDIAGRSMPVEIDLAESPLSWLYNRKGKNGERMIGMHEFKAGERLRADYERGQLAPQITRNWDYLAMPKVKQKTAGNAELTLADSAYDARRRVEQALQKTGPELSGILVDICCEQRGLEEAERHLGWPKRSGKVILRIALTALARHYGYLSEPQDEQGRRRSKIFHWGDDDYRPQIDDA